MRPTKWLVYLSVFYMRAMVIYAQTPVILDADIDSDVDDVEALAMLHHLADDAKVSLLGLIVTSDDPYAALCASAFNTYFGRPHLPIGVLKNQVALHNHSKYTKQIAQNYPRKLQTLSTAEDATTLYRRLLASSADSSVIIITIGHLSNFSNLLASKPDEISTLSGKALAEKKVKKWVCMGGQFPEGKEANFYRPDPASTVYCVTQWSRPVTFAGWEVGEKIITGGSYLRDRLPAGSPVRQAYALYNNFKGRPSWDQVAIYVLCSDADNYFEQIGNGRCEVRPNGSNYWRSGEPSNHHFLRLRKGANLVELAKKMDDMAIK
ncbi:MULTISPECIES: nucleoside hydrolase [Olivibacter]|uniref:Nucleoside hydrolase n=1 Tax=Olivibacter jilunii TaxID=985016 RepID=A0ABW6B4V5_9SPHI